LSDQVVIEEEDILGTSRRWAAGFVAAPQNCSTISVTSGSGGTGFVGIQLPKVWGATKIIHGGAENAWLGIGATDVIDYHTGSAHGIVTGESDNEVHPEVVLLRIMCFST